jgi:hypothetical protein
VSFLLEKGKFPFGASFKAEDGIRYVFIDRNLWEKYKKGELAYTTSYDEASCMVEIKDR